MNREYQDGSSSDVEFFVGTEIEHTAAFGKQTLFVVGLQPVNTILKKSSTVEHIFFGANHSFDDVAAEKINDWEDMIEYFLINGFICSIDLHVSYARLFSTSKLQQYENFIPQIRVPVPYVKTWNKNTSIKIDDIGFDQTNPGVWAHFLSNLLNDSVLTTWDKYRNDKKI